MGAFFRALAFAGMVSVPFIAGCGRHADVSLEQSIRAQRVAVSTLRKERNIGFVLLDLEKGLGTGAEDYNKLAGIVSKSERIHPARRKEPVIAVKDIDSLLKEEEVHPVKRQDLFNQALKSGGADCDTSLMYYLSIGEHIDVKISPVLAPRHAFARALLEGSEFNWETGIGSFSLDEIYEDQVSPELREKGIYLATLTREQFIASHMTTVGMKWQEKGNFRKALKMFNESIRIFPHPRSYSVRASLFFLREKIDRAISDYTSCLELDPGHFAALNGRASSYVVAVQPEKAIKDCNRGIELLENGVGKILPEEIVTECLSNFYALKGIAYEQKSNSEEARANYGVALMHNPQNSIVAGASERMKGLVAAEPNPQPEVAEPEKPKPDFTFEAVCGAGIALGAVYLALRKRNKKK